MFRCLKRGPGFYGYLWRLTGPIALQNLITFSLGLIDTLMVSWLGNTQMAAVTTANVPVFLLISIVFGVQSGLGILVSQYWGKKDMESISRAIGVAAVIDRSPDEERVLAELTDLDARFSRAREALRLGRPVTLSE